MKDRITRVSNNKPRPMVVPTWARIFNSMNAMAAIVTAKTIPADVTTEPLPPIARMMPVLSPA